MIGTKEQVINYYLITQYLLLLDFSGALVNLGKVKNEGWEFELRTKNISSEKFKWSTTFIGTTNNNTLD